MPSKEAASTAAAPLSARELFELDLNGFIVIKQFLSHNEVQYMNAVIDKALGEEFWIKFPFLELDSVFLDLLSHPQIIAICEFLLGKWFRFDGAFGFQEAPPHVGRAGVENLHGGPFANQGSFQYRWHGGRPYCGHLEVAYALERVEEGDGGLVFVPGSHKLNLSLEGRDVYHHILNKDLGTPYVYNPPLDPGDLLLFTEATIHGTMNWKRKDRRRRNLYYKYCPGYMIWRKYEETDRYLPLARNELERRLMRPPFVAGIDEEERPMRSQQWRTPTRQQS